MGVDYYQQEYYRFTYKVPDSEEFKTFAEEAGSREGRYAFYDPDLQTFSQHLEEQENRYGEKCLFENGQWKCTPDAKMRLEAIMVQHPDKNVVAIHKVLYAWRRD